MSAARGDLDCLLQLWNLEKVDIEPNNLQMNFPTNRSCVCGVDGVKENLVAPNLVPVISASVGTIELELNEADFKSCNNCYTSNEFDANWCIECGKALVGENVTPAEHRFNQKLVHEDFEDPKSGSDFHECDSFHHVGIPHNRDLEYPQQINSQYVDSLYHNNHSNEKSAKSLDVQQKLSIPYERHWETSKSYSWRKPQSKVIHSSEKLFKRTYRSVGPVIPSLDLASINTVISDQECHSQYFYSEPEKCALLYVPNEILLQIFSYLTHSEIFNCMLVCKRLLYIARDQSLWKTIRLQSVKNINRSTIKQVASKKPQHLKIVDCQGSLEVCDVTEFFIHIGENLKSLTLEMSQFGSHIVDVLLLSAVSNCVHLSSISISWVPVSEQTLMKMIQLCNCLKELCIKHPEITFSTMNIIFTHHGQHLRKLQLESTPISKFLTVIGENKMVFMESFASLFDEIDGNIIQRISYVFPRLKALYIHCTSKSQVTTMQDVVEELSQISLQTLYFKLFPRSSLDIVCCSILNQMSSLRELGSDCVDNEQLHVLCKGNLLLDTLDLTGSFVTNMCLHSILSGSFCSTLKHLKLNNCDGFNDAAVQKTIESFSANWKGTTVAQEIQHFISSSQSLRVIELFGISSAHELDVFNCGRCIIIIK